MIVNVDQSKKSIKISGSRTELKTLQVMLNKLLSNTGSVAMEQEVSPDNVGTIIFEREAYVKNSD